MASNEESIPLLDPLPVLTELDISELLNELDNGEGISLKMDGIHPMEDPRTRGFENIVPNVAVNPFTNIQDTCPTWLSEACNGLGGEQDIDYTASTRRVQQETESFIGEVQSYVQRVGLEDPGTWNGNISTHEVHDFANLISADVRRYVVHSIHPTRGSDYRDSNVTKRAAFIAGDCGPATGRVIISIHGDHYHVLQETDNRRCLEAVQRQYPWLPKKLKQQITMGTEWSPRRWANAWRYLAKEGRRVICYMQLSRRGPVYALRASLVSKAVHDTYKNQKRSTFENRHCARGFNTGRVQLGDGDFDEILQAGGTQDDDPTGQMGGKTFTTKKQLPEAATILAELGKKEWTFDAHELIKHPWTCKYMPRLIVGYKDCLLRYTENAIGIWEAKTESWSLNDYYTYFVGDGVNFNGTKFMERADSLLALDMFFDQFPNKLEIITMFCDWFDRKLKKKNTICLIGPPSCGKTWIAQLFCNIAGFHGSILSYVQKCQFLFSDIVDSRIVFHDECKHPLGDQSFIELLKQVWGGSTDVTINVKHKNPRKVKVPPVIATCNQFPLNNMADATAFDHRVNWIYPTAEMDKDLFTAACHPLAFFDFLAVNGFEEYKIV